MNKHESMSQALDRVEKQIDYERGVIDCVNMIADELQQLPTIGEEGIATTCAINKILIAVVQSLPSVVDARNEITINEQESIHLN